MKGGLAKVREKTRELVNAEIKEIDGLVSSILKGPTAELVVKPDKKKPSLQSTMFS